MHEMYKHSGDLFVGHYMLSEFHSDYRKLQKTSTGIKANCPCKPKYLPYPQPLPHKDTDDA